MKSQQAKEILMLYRPGDADANDPQLAEALSLAGQDPEIAGWFADHRALQSAVRRKFQQVATPGDLKTRILAAKRRQQHICQDTHHGNDHQQFNQQKALPMIVVWRAVHRSRFEDRAHEAGLRQFTNALAGVMIST